MSFYICSISIDKNRRILTTCGHGMHWSTYAIDGDTSSSHGLTISIYNMTADPERTWRRRWIFGRKTYLSTSTQTSISRSRDLENGDDIVVALGLRDRIASISLYFRTMLQLERCTEVMQEPFPVLRTLFLDCVENDSDAPVVIDSFLGVSATRLQRISLFCVPFPALQKLLLSTKDLVVLRLDEITNAGYISLDALATSLSMLKRLEYIGVFFQSIRSFPS